MKGKKTHQAAITTSALDVDEREPLGTMLPLTAPATDAARQWDGWGTALKPAHEPILVFRKPLVGTVAANVQQWGTGALHIEACRVGTETIRSNGEGANGLSGQHKRQGDRPYTKGVPGKPTPSEHTGRWPPNVALSHSEQCQRVGTRRVKADKGGEAPAAATWGTYGTTPGRHYADADGLEAVEEWACVDGCAVKALAEQSGERKAAGHYNGEVTAARHGFIGGNTDAGWGYGDTGTAARFFPNFEPSPLDDVTPFLYTAKASRREREAGLEGMEERDATDLTGRQADSPGLMRDSHGGLSGNPYKGSAPVVTKARNHHPTVKSLSLMKWLVRLVTPPGGVVLDPFTGSGTTGMAAVLEGFGFVGIEREAEYLEIARRRIAWAVEQEPPLLRATGD